jgi:hypothetical protein
MPNDLLSHRAVIRRVLKAQHLLIQLQCPPVHLLSHLVLILIVEHQCEVVHTRQRGWVLTVEHILL